MGNFFSIIFETCGLYDDNCNIDTDNIIYNDPDYILDYNLYDIGENLLDNHEHV